MTFTTILDALRWRAVNQPDRRAFTFLIDGDVGRPVHLTYGDLDLRARQAAEAIRAAVPSGNKPVLLFFPPGLDVIVALFGCFYAGTLAVVADSPRRRSSLSGVEGVIEDSGATLG